MNQKNKPKRHKTDKKDLQKWRSIEITLYKSILQSLPLEVILNIYKFVLLTVISSDRWAQLIGFDDIIGDAFDFLLSEDNVSLVGNQLLVVISGLKYSIYLSEGLIERISNRKPNLRKLDIHLSKFSSYIINSIVKIPHFYNEIIASPEQILSNMPEQAFIKIRELSIEGEQDVEFKRLLGQKDKLKNLINVKVRFNFSVLDIELIEALSRIESLKYLEIHLDMRNLPLPHEMIDLLLSLRGKLHLKLGLYNDCIIPSSESFLNGVFPRNSVFSVTPNMFRRIVSSMNIIHYPFRCVCFEFDQLMLYTNLEKLSIIYQHYPHVIPPFVNSSLKKLVISAVGMSGGFRKSKFDFKKLVNLEVLFMSGFAWSVDTMNSIPDSLKVLKVDGSFYEKPLHLPTKLVRLSLKYLTPKYEISNLKLLSHLRFVEVSGFDLNHAARFVSSLSPTIQSLEISIVNCQGELKLDKSIFNFNHLLQLERLAIRADFTEWELDFLPPNIEEIFLSPEQPNHFQIKVHSFIPIFDKFQLNDTWGSLSTKKLNNGKILLDFRNANMNRFGKIDLSSDEDFMHYLKLDYIPDSVIQFDVTRFAPVTIELPRLMIPKICDLGIGPNSENIIIIETS